MYLQTQRMAYGKLMCPVYRRDVDVYKYSYCVELSLEGGRGMGAGDASLQRSKDGIFNDFKKMPAIFMVGAETTRMVRIYDEDTEVVVNGYDPDRYYRRACVGVIKRDQTLMVSNNTSIVWRRGGVEQVSTLFDHHAELRLTVSCARMKVYARDVALMQKNSLRRIVDNVRVLELDGVYGNFKLKGFRAWDVEL